MKPGIVITISSAVSIVLMLAAWLLFFNPRLATKLEVNSQLQKVVTADSTRLTDFKSDIQTTLQGYKNYLQDTLSADLTTRIAGLRSQVTGLKGEYGALVLRIDALDSGQQALAKLFNDSLNIFRQNLAESFDLTKNQLTQQVGMLTQTDVKLESRMTRAESFLEKQVVPRLNTPLRFLGLDIFKKNAKIPALTEFEQKQTPETQETADQITASEKK